MEPKYEISDIVYISDKNHSCYGKQGRIVNIIKLCISNKIKYHMIAINKDHMFAWEENITLMPILVQQLLAIINK